MFIVQPIHCFPNSECNIAVTDLTNEDFRYFDKDGFELNLAEQKFYRAMNYPINHPILNHCCWQEPWFEMVETKSNLLLDHCMFLCRCNYTGAAVDQLESLKSTIPYADLLIKTKAKWGFDFALDAVKDDTVFEVLHIEYDHYNYDSFCNAMENFESTIKNTDWVDAAEKIWNKRDSWKNLQGFEQNHWKANYLINWFRAEYTEKSFDISH